MQEPRVGGKTPVVMDLQNGSRSRHPSNYAGPHRGVDGDQEGRAQVAPDPEAPQSNATGLVVHPETGRSGAAPD